MPWVAIDVNIAGDPAVHRIAAALRVRVPEVVGLLGLTFAGMAQHAPDGELADVPDTLLEQWATWHGKRGAFARLFRAELCDETGLVRAWEKYNGANIRRLDHARERARAWREKQDRARTERETNGNGTHSRMRTKRAAYASTEQNSTEQRTRSTTKAGRAGARDPLPAWVGELREGWRALVGDIAPSTLHRAMTHAVEQYGVETIVAAMERYAEARLGAGKERVFAWFAKDVTLWIERTKPLVDPESGTLTARGMAVLEATR